MCQDREPAGQAEKVAGWLALLLDFRETERDGGMWMHELPCSVQ